MTTAIITKTKLISNAHGNTLSFIDNRTYVTDPRNPDSTETLRVFVYDRDPFHKAINFSDFPYIILEFPTLEQTRISCNGKVKHLMWEQSITVRAATDGSSNVGNSQGKSDVLDIGDDLFALFNTEARKQSFRDLRMYSMTLTKLSSDSGTIKQKEVYEDQYNLSYEERIQVSD